MQQRTLHPLRSCFKHAKNWMFLGHYVLFNVTYYELFTLKKPFIFDLGHTVLVLCVCQPV